MGLVKAPAPVVPPDLAELDAVFDDDYLYFYEPVQPAARCERETDFILQTLGLGRGDRLLDAPCGYGRIANRAASRGVEVVGVDRSETLLRRARAEAARAGVGSASFVLGDLREMSFQESFDGVVCWFSSIGFANGRHDDIVLRRFAAALTPGGRLLIEVVRQEAIVSSLSRERSLPVVVSEIGDDAIVDRVRLSPDGRGISVDRLVCRSGTVRRLALQSRAYTFAELREALERAGFADVRELDLLGPDRELVTSWALVAVAERA
jgi:SAM-dependent methyltransferase